MNSFPRIAADPNGAIYLTYRTPVPGQSPMGTVWVQNFSYLDGLGMERANYASRDGLLAG